MNTNSTEVKAISKRIIDRRQEQLNLLIGVS